MSAQRWQWAWLGFAALVFAGTWWRPIWPFEQALHSSLSIVALVLMAWLVQTRRLSTPAFALLAGFLSVHCIAARWLYSNVPYDAWLQACCHWSPDAFFASTRNHFDRLVHLLYGICLTPALIQLSRPWSMVRPSAPFWRAVALIMCSSLIYEWIEWLVALLLDPAAAEAYNGQQGDIWDAHQDMLLATLGALFWWPWDRWQRRQAGPLPRP